MLRDTGASGTKSPAVVVIRSIRIDPHLPVSQCATPIVIFQLFGVYSAAFAEIHNAAREKSRIYLAGSCKFMAHVRVCVYMYVASKLIPFSYAAGYSLIKTWSGLVSSFYNIFFKLDLFLLDISLSEIWNGIPFVIIKWIRREDSSVKLRSQRKEAVVLHSLNAIVQRISLINSILLITSVDMLVQSNLYKRDHIMYEIIVQKKTRCVWAYFNDLVYKYSLDFRLLEFRSRLTGEEESSRDFPWSREYRETWDRKQIKAELWSYPAIKSNIVRTALETNRLLVFWASVIVANEDLDCRVC